MYVIDTGNLMKLSPQGEILRTIKINDPKGVAVEGNELYVTSADKVLCFDMVLLNLKWSLSDHREWNPFPLTSSIPFPSSEGKVRDLTRYTLNVIWNIIHRVIGVNIICPASFLISARLD